MSAAQEVSSHLEAIGATIEHAGDSLLLRAGPKPIQRPSSGAFGKRSRSFRIAPTKGGTARIGAEVCTRHRRQAWT